MSEIRVVVADDDRSVRLALEQLINMTDGLELVAAVDSVDEALEAADRLHPHVLVADVEMPSGGGRRLAREVSEQHPEVYVLAYSSSSDERSIESMLGAGASGYVTKRTGPAELLDAIRRAAEGRVVFSDDVSLAILRRIRGRDHGPAAYISAHEVRKVFAAGALSIVFQPIVDLSSGTTVAAEALTRISALPQLGPDAWFAAAESAGLLTLAEVAAINAALRSSAMLPPGLRIALNVSPSVVISREFHRAIALVDPKSLILEITERAVIEDYDSVRSAIEPLRAAGIQLAVDDAGAGFASLRHILQLDPDIIKLDRELCAGINRDSKRIALAGGLTSFAFGLGAQIVAEGIETQAELDVLTALGVGMGQGYLLGRPQPAGEAWPAAAA